MAVAKREESEFPFDLYALGHKGLELIKLHVRLDGRRSSMQKIAHLEWNLVGTQLACIDEHGGLCIWQTGKCFDQMSIVFEALPRSKIVGFTWLNPDKQVR